MTHDFLKPNIRKSLPNKGGGGGGGIWEKKKIILLKYDTRLFETQHQEILTK